jgi:hypothetical protein
MPLVLTFCKSEQVPGSVIASRAVQLSAPRRMPDAALLCNHHGLTRGRRTTAAFALRNRKTQQIRLARPVPQTRGRADASQRTCRHRAGPLFSKRHGPADAARRDSKSIHGNRSPDIRLLRSRRGPHRGPAQDDTCCTSWYDTPRTKGKPIGTTFGGCIRQRWARPSKNPEACANKSRWRFGAPRRCVRCTRCGGQDWSAGCFERLPSARQLSTPKLTRDLEHLWSPLMFPGAQP